MNDLKNCFYCKVSLITKSIHPEYHRCPNCGTFYRISQQEYASYIDGDFRNKYELTASKVLKNDSRHYFKIGNRPDFKKVFDECKYDNIYSFGGGLPKLESYLKSNIISVFDLNADIYEDHMNEFKQLYPIGNTPVEIHTAMVDSSFIKSIHFKENDLITFVHFLEHLWAYDIIRILDSIPTEIPILIYQPNPGNAKGSGWLHFSDQHMTLISGKTFIDFIKQWYNANILSYIEIDNDFFMMFKKPSI